MAPFQLRSAALGLVVALVVAACGSGSESGSEPVELVLDGELATLDGGSIDLASLQGQDVVFWFWAPW